MIKYTFHSIDLCNMCGAPQTDFKTLGLRLNRSQGVKPSGRNGIAVTVNQCRQCGLIFANPQPVPDSFSDQYDMSAETYWKTDDISWDPSYFQEELAILKKLNPDLCSGRGLDIGAGYGRCMLSMSNVGMDAYGFEPAKDFYDLGISRFHIPSEKFKFCTIEEADYPENYFGFITFGAVLEHVHDPNQALVKALRWVAPGGLIHIEVPSSKWFVAKLFNFYYKVFCLSNFVTNISPMHSPFHHFEFSKKSFERNGQINGYELVYTKIDVCSTTLPFRFLDGILKKWMKLTGTGMQLTVFLRKK